MARFTIMPSGTRPIEIVDVSQSVRLGASNRKDDVLLVQFALNKIMEKASLPDPTGKPRRTPIGGEFPPLPPLIVDGVFGRKSFTALKIYQSILIAGGVALLADGAVDPVHQMLAGLRGDPASQKALTISGKVGRMTIFKLNKDILLLHGRVLDPDELPLQVRDSLRISRAA